MPLLPYVTCICPACFNEINVGECEIVSGVTGDVLKKQTKGLASMKVQPLDGPKYTRDLAQRRCPHCGYLLPSNIEQVPNFTFVVVGDLYSGKSHYIASLIQQIKTDWMAQSTSFARFTCLTPEVEKIYIQDYINPLFLHKRTLLPTQRASQSTQKPLIYKLVVEPAPKHPPLAINMMIYDTSGEDFESATRLVNVARFALTTDAFIFVVDPFTMTPIFQHFPPSIQNLLQPAFNNAQGRRAADRLNTTIDVVQRFRGEQDGSSFRNTPIAVMLTKADLFQYFLPANSYTFMHNPVYGNKVDLADINAVDREVRDLLWVYQQGDLLATTSRFRQLKFFATSATGGPPDANGNFQNVVPCRCLDPVLWILYELGILKKLV